MSIKTVMMGEVKDEFEKIGKMELGSDAHVKTAGVANATMDRLIKMDEVENERKQLELKERELEIEEQKLTKDRKLDKIKTIGSWVMFGICTGVSIWANIDSKKFEGAFTHTTEAGRSSERKLLGLMDRFK